MKKILTILLTLLSTTCMGMHSDKGKRPLRPRPAATEKTRLSPTIICSICLNAMSVAEREFLPCGHDFCRSCLDKCRRAKIVMCPLCRQPMNACWASDIKAPIDQYDDADCHGASSSRRIAPPTAAYHAGVSSPYETHEPGLQHDIDSDVNPFSRYPLQPEFIDILDEYISRHSHDDDLVAKTDDLSVNVQMYKRDFKRERLSCCGIYMPTICCLFCCKR